MSQAANLLVAGATGLTKGCTKKFPEKFLFKNMDEKKIEKRKTQLEAVRACAWDARWKRHRSETRGQRREREEREEGEQ